MTSPNSNNGDGEKFSDALLCAMSRKNMSRTKMGRHMGVRRQTFDVWIEDNKFPMEGFREMCKSLFQYCHAARLRGFLNRKR